MTIIHLHKSDIQELLQRQHDELLSDLGIDHDHPMSEKLQEHFEELLVNILFKNQEVGEQYSIPESVKEKEEEIHAKRLSVLEELKERGVQGNSSLSTHDNNFDDWEDEEPMQITKDELDEILRSSRSPYSEEQEGQND